MHNPRSPAAPMRGHVPPALIIAAVVLALLLAAAVLAWLWLQWAALESGYPFVVDTLRIAIFLLPIALGAYAVTTGIVIVWRRLGWKESIFADKQIALKRAEVQVAPLATSFSFHDSRSTAEPLLLEDAEPEATAIVVPTFAQLLDSGAVAAERDFILGYGDEGAVTGDWKSLYSAGIGGLQGSGKTWTAVYLLTQSAIHGAKLIICDPHAGDGESLATRVGALAPAFMCGIADDDTTIHASLKLAESVLKKRKDGDADRTPLIVAVDEWSTLRRGQLADLLPTIIESFSTEGRKFGCNILLLGQRWDKASVGDFRNTLTSSYVHRMRSEEARMMTGLPAGILPANTLSLKPGESYFISTRGDMARVQIPLMTQADIARVGQQLGMKALPDPGLKPAEKRLEFGFRPTAKTEPLMPVSSQIHAGTDPAASQSVSGQSITAEAIRAYCLFYDENKDITEIVFILRNLKPNQPPRYQAALKEIQALIRAASKAGIK